MRATPKLYWSHRSLIGLILNEVLFTNFSAATLLGIIRFPKDTSVLQNIKYLPWVFFYIPAGASDQFEASKLSWYALGCMYLLLGPELDSDSKVGLMDEGD